MRTIFSFIFGLLTTSAFTQNANQGAVDTLTKEVAKVVFANINQPKAQDIYEQLIDCGDGCDPQIIIRTVGGWDAVGVKMQELSEIKNTATFSAMSPGDANVAIRRQLAQFYDRYKADNNYGKPLSPSVQLSILRKIDGLLPPNPEPTPTMASTTPTQSTVGSDTTDIDPTLFRMSQLERELKEKEGNDSWTMILSAIGGLLVGGGAGYFFAYSTLKSKYRKPRPKASNSTIENT